SERGIACLRRSAEAEGDRAETWALLGAACLKAKRTKAAVDCLERALTLAPDDRRVFRGYLNALYARGVRLVSRGEHELAAQMLEFAIANGLDGAAIRLWRSKALRAMGDVGRALAECESALALSPSDSSIRWVRAGLLLAAGRKADAFAEFESLRAADPRLPQMPPDDRALARLRASIDFREGRWKEASRASLDLLRKEPRDAPLLALAAESLRSLGEAERSRDTWKRAIEVAPRESYFRLGLAYALWDLGEYGPALEAAERARELGAEPGEADYCAALCRSRLGEDPGTLLPMLQSLVRDRARSGGGADPRLLFALGEALYRSGRPDLAGGWFEKVVRLVPEHELSLLYGISVAESLGDDAARSRAYAAYLSRYPDNSKLRREYVELLCDRG
ncbi:MAG: tetratricopeptide repeat protein, partial [Spirochaetaceae bacterium]|nr:tetratricopeptide repeat protein [Spirochaetaceae bacterium]